MIEVLFHVFRYIHLSPGATSEMAGWIWFKLSSLLFDRHLLDCFHYEKCKILEHENLNPCLQSILLMATIRSHKYI